MRANTPPARIERARRCVLLGDTGGRGSQAIPLDPRGHSGDTGVCEKTDRERERESYIYIYIYIHTNIYKYIYIYIYMHIYNVFLISLGHATEREKVLSKLSSP